MQGEMRCFCAGPAHHGRLELGAVLKTQHLARESARGWNYAVRNSTSESQGLMKTRRLNSQAFTALGTTRVDHRTTAARFHAYEETVGTGAANFGGLVSAFHGKTSKRFLVE